MRPHRIRTTLVTMALALLAVGCVTNPSLPEPHIPYTPSELTGESSEQLRSRLETFLNQATRFYRHKPIAMFHDRGDVRQLEVGEDYVFMRFERAWIAENEPRRDEYYSYGFPFERLSDLTFNGETCWRQGGPLPDGAVTFSAPPGRQLCDVLYTLSLRAQRQHDDDKARFAQLAPQARSRSTAAVPENLRRLIVQAEAQRQDKAYAAAAATFRKVIRQEPAAYPPAYFNLALLYEMQRDYPRAMESMQRYLLLQPQASDARAAQDKIYEWEMRAGKP